ncbi:MAG: hypothetical protein H6Q12_33 [Bacteroidetes bacterium]|nr:hypothetical protein [Bacteroidota bacterium]
MEKKNQKRSDRYVSVEKVEALFAQLSQNLVNGRKKIRAEKSDNGMSFIVGNECIQISIQQLA